MRNSSAISLWQHCCVLSRGLWWSTQCTNRLILDWRHAINAHRNCIMSYRQLLCGRWLVGAVPIWALWCFARPIKLELLWPVCCWLLLCCGIQQQSEPGMQSLLFTGFVSTVGYVFVLFAPRRVATPVCSVLKAHQCLKWFQMAHTVLVAHPVLDSTLHYVLQDRIVCLVYR